LTEALTAIVFSEYSAGHDTGSHPENQSRLDTIRSMFEEDGLLEDRLFETAKPVEPDVLTLVHDPILVEIAQELSERGGGFIDGDTFVSPGSFLAARAAVGSAMTAVDRVLSGDVLRAFSFARPPGHHAERARQMGFCLFNNIAIATQHALDTGKIRRAAIVDWDVHHGNGTQDIFYESAEVLFCSLHQWPLFPGSGLESERGSGSGEGFTLNVRLPAGSGDVDYLAVLDGIVEPELKAFEPDLLLVSAGFDAHRDDPLSMMAVTEAGFAAMASRVRGWADDLCGGRLVLTLEGGYNLRALSDSVAATIAALDAPAPAERGQ
jgi:acetoin utilization deacetylase AcuC-like enzyme